MRVKNTSKIILPQSTGAMPIVEITENAGGMPTMTKLDGTAYTNTDPGFATFDETEYAVVKRGFPS